MSKYQVIFPEVEHEPGLGNHMFQYAVAKLLADNNKTTIFLDKKRKCNINFLKYFKNIHLDDELKQNLFKTIKEMETLDFIDGLTEIKMDSFGIRLHGFFQNPHYILKDKEKVKNMFEFKDEIEAYSTNYINTVRNENKNKEIVSIHLRRPDEPNDKGFLYTVYFQSNMDDILKKFNLFNTIFLIFSNDKRDCIKKFKVMFSKINYKWVDEDESISLCIMSKCDHHILSASSFGWWAAFLNKKEDKIVIAPKPWYNPLSVVGDYNLDYMYLNEWTIYQFSDYLDTLRLEINFNNVDVLIFKKHIEAQFTPEMNWQNYGVIWNIHIDPIDNTSNSMQMLLEKTHYLNYKPYLFNSNKNEYTTNKSNKIDIINNVDLNALGTFQTN